MTYDLVVALVTTKTMVKEASILILINVWYKFLSPKLNFEKEIGVKLNWFQEQFSKYQFHIIPIFISLKKKFL